MRVRILKAIAGELYGFAAGELADVPDVDGRLMIKGGAAAEIPAPEGHVPPKYPKQVSLAEYAVLPAYAVATPRPSRPAPAARGKRL